jgi:hypothetical protein
VWFEELHVGVEEPFTPALKAHPAFRLARLDDIAAVGGGGFAVRWDDAVAGLRRFYTFDPLGGAGGTNCGWVRGRCSGALPLVRGFVVEFVSVRRTNPTVSADCRLVSLCGKELDNQRRFRARRRSRLPTCTKFARGAAA